MKLATLFSSGILAVSAVLAPQGLWAQDQRSETETIVKDYLATHPDEVGEIVKSYFIKHPEAVGQILAELIKRHQNASPGAGVKSVPDRGAAIAANAAELFSSPHQVTLGDPQGDVTLVEFFDYNCGFCKRALSDTLALVKDDLHLKIVLKEFPILGPGSTEAARIAIAVRMQDPDGRKYLAFHQELLGSPGSASREKALAAAKDQDLDLARIDADAASDEAGATLSEDMKLASALGFAGTPSYVVGGDVVLGAVGLAALKERIEKARAAASH
jgi:protein-disulfide isomerase